MHHLIKLYCHQTYLEGHIKESYGSAFAPFVYACFDDDYIANKLVPRIKQLDILAETQAKVDFSLSSVRTSFWDNDVSIFDAWQIEHAPANEEYFRRESVPHRDKNGTSSGFWAHSLTGADVALEMNIRKFADNNRGNDFVRSHMMHLRICTRRMTGNDQQVMVYTSGSDVHSADNGACKYTYSESCRLQSEQKELPPRPDVPENLTKFTKWPMFVCSLRSPHLDYDSADPLVMEIIGGGRKYAEVSK